MQNKNVVMCIELKAVYQLILCTDGIHLLGGNINSRKTQSIYKVVLELNQKKAKKSMSRRQKVEQSHNIK
jgi:hypothetical protein